MNENMIAGEGRDIIEKVKETAGDVTGDRSLRGDGLTDQLSGKAQKIIGAAKDMIAGDGAPLLAKARRFTRERPFASTALAGVVSFALFTVLRGKR